MELFNILELFFITKKTIKFLIIICTVVLKAEFMLSVVQTVIFWFLWSQSEPTKLSFKYDRPIQGDPPMGAVYLNDVPTGSTFGYIENSYTRLL